MEVEAKVALATPEGIRARLASWASSPAILEEDTFFQHPGRDLAAGDEALRLRRTATGLELTYKGPRQAGPLKVRKEVTARLADDPTALLSALGFAPTVRLRKTRQRFRKGALEAALDHVEGLGWFIEVEAVGLAGDAARQAVLAGLDELGLTGRRFVTESYVALALAAGSSAVDRV
jgi:adenylate cyclase, class 2